MGCFIWLCCVDFLCEDLSLLFQVCLELFNFYVLLILFSFVYSNYMHIGPLFSFSHIFLLFPLLCFTFLHIFYGVFHSSEFHRDLLVFHLFIDCIFISRSVTNLHLIVLPFCLWAYLLLQKWFSLFLSDHVYFLI